MNKFQKIAKKVTRIVALGILSLQLVVPVSNALAASNGSSTKAEENLTFHMTGVQTDGYIRVNRHDGNDPEYMISHQFADQYNRIAYCMDSEKPSPSGHTMPNTAEGNDQFLRMFLSGYPTKTAKELGTANDTEAWYATQVVSWTLAGDWKWGDIVWSTPQHSQAEVDRVHHAANIIYNEAINGTETQNTTFKLEQISKTKENGFHKFTYKVNSNKKGVATIKLNNEVAGLQVVDKSGQPIKNNQVNVNEEFSILIPVSTDTGKLSFNVDGKVKNYKSLVYGSASNDYQRAITAFTTDETPVVKNASLDWKRAEGQIRIHKVDQEGKDVKGAEFTLTDDKGKKEVAVSDEKGIVTFKIFEGSIYTLDETKTPQGYTGTFHKEGITLKNDGQVLDIKAINAKDKIIIKKITQTGHKESAWDNFVGFLSQLFI